MAGCGPGRAPALNGGAIGKGDSCVLVLVLRSRRAQQQHYRRSGIRNKLVWKSALV